MIWRRFPPEYVSMWRLNISRRRVAVPEATRSHKVLMVKAGAEVPVRDRRPRARRMDEAPATSVDPDVIYVATVDAEKDEITRGKGIQCHRACRTLLRIGRAWNLHTCALVHVYSEPTAVETLQIRATEVVGSADELRG
jgi:hypothetical protein